MLTQYNKHDVSSPVETSQSIATVIEGEIDRTAQNGTAVAICEPIREELPSVLRRWVAEHYRTFGRPEETGSDATCRRTDINEPYCPVAIVLGLKSERK